MELIKSLLPICFSSFCVYIFIIIALRVFGKRDLAQLSVIDVVFILLISNAVQNAMVGSNNTLLGGLTAATTLFVTNAVFKKLFYKFPKLNEILQGHPIMLVYEGKMIIENMKKTGISKEELAESIREHGVASIDEVNLAVLETDGNISILSNEFNNRTHKKRKIKKSINQIG